MRLPVPPPPPSPVFPSDDLNMKNLKSVNSRSWESQFDPEPHSRHQPWQTRCSKQAGASFITGIRVLFFVCVTPPAHAICLFGEIWTSRRAFLFCASFLGRLHNRGPALCKAFAAKLLADCCLQPSLAVWRNVEYSPLKWQARTGWELSHGFTRISPPLPPLKTQPHKLSFFSYFLPPACREADQPPYIFKQWALPPNSNSL